MKQIDFGELWVVLCECLDLVRDLEGIVDAAPESETPSSSSSSSSSFSSVKLGGEGRSGRGSAGGRSRGPIRIAPRVVATGTSRASAALARARSHAQAGGESGGSRVPDEEEEDGMELSLSALTMRFMPLIECFLTVCGSTSLRVPALAGESGEDNCITKERADSSLEATALGKRKAPEPKAAAAPAIVPAPVPVSVLIPEAPKVLTEQEKLEELRDAGALAIANAVRALSDTVPGARFRNNTGYLQMQLELDDSSPAAPLLLRFADRNRVLLNMVLKNNVHLLESSFSALVTVPRCRHLLHFDIKRYTSRYIYHTLLYMQFTVLCCDLTSVNSFTHQLTYQLSCNTLSAQGILQDEIEENETEQCEGFARHSAHIRKEAERVR